MEGQTSKKILRGKLQRVLRNAQTEAELRLWQSLRGRQMSGVKFRRQHPFEHYILDFACLAPKIVVELDGGQHCDASTYDARRTAALEKAGFVVLRFWNNEVFENPEGVLQVIWNAVCSRGNPSPPNPPLEGEG